MDVVELGWSGVDWMGLAQDGYGSGWVQMESSCERCNKPSGSIKSGYTADDLPSSAQLHIVQ
jgi:hypothetical protein